MVVLAPAAPAAKAAHVPWLWRVREAASAYLPLLRRAAFACAPANAHAEVRAVVHHVTQAAGGYGAAREFCDLLLCAAGRYASLLDGERPTPDASPASA
jgi:hypothetical protein